MENTKESGGKFMRLYNIYYVCASCFPLLEKVKTSEIKNGSTVTGWRIEEWQDCKIALNELYKISCLREYVENTYKTLNNIESAQSAPGVSIETGRSFMNELKNLRQSVKTIISLYESMDIGESQIGIDVKIPKCKSLKEYMDYLKEIDFVFTQCPYLLLTNEEIKFNNVDVGSQWLSFVVITAGTFGILNNIAKLVDKAISIKSHLLTLKQQEEMLETMKLKNEATEETIDVFKKMKRITMEGYVKDLEADIGKLNDGEERGKVEKTLEKLVVLIDKGVEIYSSIETPNEVKALFPMNEDNPILPDNIVKLLEQKGKIEE